MIKEIKKYYSAAKRVALLAQDNLTQKWYHVFSVIELLPQETPKYSIPTKEWYANKIIRAKESAKSDSYSFYLMVNDIETVDEAISIFENPTQHNHIDGELNHFFNLTFVKEPSGNIPLVLPSNMYTDEGLGSVLPKRHSGLFCWAQIDAGRKVEGLFKSGSITKEMRAMSQLTTDWLGFDIWTRSEHIGNIYLAAANPYFRDIDFSLSHNPIGIFYHFKQRQGINEIFTLRVMDRHGDNIALDKSFTIKDPVGLIELPHEPHFVELRIYNASEDLIAVHPPVTFIKNINFETAMKQADFHVKVETVDGGKEFVVEKFTSTTIPVIDEPSSFNQEYFFKDAENQRKHIEHKNTKEFIFFPGTKTPEEKTELKKEARSAIIDIMNQAHETCYLCDPYFNALDLLDYAFHIKNSGVTLRILNCKGGSFIDKTKAAQMLNILNEYNKKPFGKIECRMLRGDSILHDRFIITDLNVWYLGSSFSEFGNRATCLAKVPESSNQQIVKEVEKWFFNLGGDYSQAIEDYVNSDTNG